jgi:chromosome segregation ATPase
MGLRASKQAEGDRVQRDINEAYLKACRERDELRADLQCLMDESKASTEAMDRARKEIESLRAYNEMLLKVEREHVAEIERRSEQHEIDDGVQEKLYEERDDALHQAERLAHEVQRLQRENGALARTYALSEEKLRERTESGVDAIVDAVIERGSPTLDRILAERDDARSEVITLEWQLSEANKEIDRLRGERCPACGEVSAKTLMCRSCTLEQNDHDAAR